MDNRYQCILQLDINAQNRDTHAERMKVDVSKSQRDPRTRQWGGGRSRSDGSLGRRRW
jgi:hypothetical protein